MIVGDRTGQTETYHFDEIGVIGESMCVIGELLDGDGGPREPPEPSINLAGRAPY